MQMTQILVLVLCSAVLLKIPAYRQGCLLIRSLTITSTPRPTGDVDRVYCAVQRSWALSDTFRRTHTRQTRFTTATGNEHKHHIVNITKVTMQRSESFHDTAGPYPRITRTLATANRSRVSIRGRRCTIFLTSSLIAMQNLDAVFSYCVRACWRSQKFRRGTLGWLTP